MKELILHIGYSKCASSTLQSFLSLNFSDKNLDKEYCAIHNNGEILRGSRLKQIAFNSPYGYCNSIINFSNIQQVKQNLEKIKLEMKDKITIISNEGLSNKNTVTEEVIDLFDSLDVPIKIFALTRPPVDWFNASWWQWGCWSELSINEYFEQNKPINIYADIMQWSKLKSVIDISVADISQDPIETFLQFVCVENNKSFSKKDINISSSADLLRFLIKNKERYNRTIHNPTIEFVLNTFLKSEGKKPPFVVNSAMAKEILEPNIEDNKKLLEMIDLNKNQISDINREKYTDCKHYIQNKDFNFQEFLNQNYSNQFLVDLVNTIIQKDRW